MSTDEVRSILGRPKSQENLEHGQRWSFFDDGPTAGWVCVVDFSSDGGTLRLAYFLNVQHIVFTNSLHREFGSPVDGGEFRSNLFLKMRRDQWRREAPPNRGNATNPDSETVRHNRAFVKKTGLILGVAVGLLLLAGLLPSPLVWDGGAHVEFRFHVVDARLRRPIEGAKVRVLRYDQLSYLSDTNVAAVLPCTATDVTGKAIVSVLCGAGGSKGILGKTGNFVISQELAVEADGYRPLQSALENMVGGRRWPLSKRVFDVELVLFKNP